MHSDSARRTAQERGAGGSVFTGLLSLMRPVNAAVALFGIAAACIIAGARADDWKLILLAAFSGMIAGSAGNVINDVFDVAIDRINKPQRAIASGAVARGTATAWAGTCMLAALLLSIPLGTGPLLIVAASGVLMYAYSAYLKRIPLLGNVTVGILTGAAFLFGALAAGDAAAGIVPALFACFFNFAREILKDVEDMRGDHAANIMTFPLRAGERPALAVASAVIGLVMLGTAVPMLIDLYHPLYFWVVLFGVDSVLVYVLISLWNDRSTGNIARLNVLLKFDMLAGITAILLGSVAA